VTADLPRAELVEAGPGHDGGEPPAEVLDCGVIVLGEPDPAVLDVILGVWVRAEQAVGECRETVSLGVAAFKELAGGVHRSHFLSLVGHQSDRPAKNNVTRRNRGAGTNAQPGGVYP
jgi:hypothetical protein